MWDDFQIGPKHDHNGAIHIRYNSNLSENVDEYWYSDDLIGGHICKESEAGKKIAKLINKEYNEKLVIKLVHRLAFAVMKPHKILAMVKKAKEEAYERGQRDKVNEIQQVLRIY